MKERMNKTLVMAVMVAFGAIYYGYMAFETRAVRDEKIQYAITHKWNWLVTTDTVSLDELFKLQQLEKNGKSVYNGRDFYTVVNAKGDSYNIKSIEDIGGVERRMQAHKNYLGFTMIFLAMLIIYVLWIQSAEFGRDSDDDYY